MKVNQAITYLTDIDKEVSAAYRFQVLTGFISPTREKTEQNWVKSLSEKNVLSTLATKEVTGGGISGFISYMTSTEDLQSRLKSSYKAAIVPGADQAAKQEVYIQHVIDMLTKYQKEECLASFEFEDPAKLLEQISKPATSSKLTA